MRNQLCLTRRLLPPLMSLALLHATVACIAAERISNACGLLSRSEIRDALGAEPVGMANEVIFRGTTSLCHGRIGGVTLTVRVSVRSDQDRANEATIAEMITASGGKIDTISSARIDCTTIVPSAAMAAEYGYDTMCTTTAGQRELAVQAQTHQLNLQLPVAKLRPLVELAAKRLASQR